MQNAVSVEITDIFNEIRPYLIFKARSFGVPNPADVVQEWLTKAFIIATNFDKGITKKRAFDVEAGLSVDFDAARHTQQDFIKSFKGYLKKSFINDLIKNYRLQEKANKYAYAEIASNSANRPLDCSDTNFESIDIKDIISIIIDDNAKIEMPIMSSAEVIKKSFLEAVLLHCNTIYNEYGNIAVAVALDVTDNSHFFTKDFRETLEDGIRKQLCKALIDSENPIIIEKLGVLIADSGKATLQKRICRYFYNHLGGYPKRLRKRLRSK